MRLKLSIAAILGGAILLAGCKRHEEPPEQNVSVEAPAPEAPPAPEPEPVAPPAEPVNEAKPKPLPTTSADQQVLDDADATGMTARVNRSDEAGNEAASGANHQQ